MRLPPMLGAMTVFFWWLALQGIGLLALPLTMWLFRALPGRGIAWSKALGLLVVGWAAWFAAMLNLTAFNLGAVLIGCAVLVGASWYVSRGAEPGALRAAVRSGWRSYLVYEILFVLVLWAGVQLRMRGAYGSAIHNTEKPMELMLLQAVLTSPTFPPQDLWLSGYAVNYYYLGYVFIAVLKVLSGAPLGVAFNLGVATIYGLTALGVAGLLAELIGLRFRPAGLPRMLRPGTLAAMLLAVVLVLVAGNQIGALQRIVGSARVNHLGDSQRVAVLWQAIRGIEPRQVSPESVKASEGIWETSSTLPPMDPANFDWWAPSRAIFDDSAAGQVIVDGAPPRPGKMQNEVITEFPFFSFYLGDMHPHVLALPFALLVIGLALATLVRADLPGGLASGRGRLELALSGLLLGSLYMLNSWDAPTYGFLYAAALALLLRRLSASWAWRSWLGYGRQLGLALLAAAILFAPFLLTFDSFAGRDEIPAPFDKIPLISTLGHIIAPARDHSGWTDLLAIFGLFLVPLLAWWARQLRDWLPWALTSGTLLVGLLLGIPALAFGPLAFYLFQAAWQTDREHEDRARTFALLLGGLGALLIVVTDIIYLRDIFDSRFNTIFKVYYQIWLLLALASAYAVWSLLHSGRWRRPASLLWAAPWALLLAGALVYPVSTLAPATTSSWEVPRVLDGLIYSSQFTQGARGAAAWLAANAPPEARLASAVGESYQKGGEVATLSGRPTLLGWAGAHESFWRTKQPSAREQIGARINDLSTIYTSADLATVRGLLASYKVGYVLVGPNELAAYPSLNAGAIAQLGPKVYDADGWAIYQVTN
jgi:YYY domain-containing protein